MNCERTIKIGKAIYYCCLPSGHKGLGHEFVIHEKDVQAHEAAQQSAHPTVLNVREIETVCPNCSLVFDVPVPESHSG